LQEFIAGWSCCFLPYKAVFANCAERKAVVAGFGEFKQKE